MDELRLGLEEALWGRGKLIMLVGEPGIGKTRLATELAAYAHCRGVLVLKGHCYESEGAPPYWPWAQALRSYISDREPTALRTEIGSGAADIAQMERHAQVGARPWLAPTQYAYAAMLLKRGKAGNRKQAGELLTWALATALELGMNGLRSKIQRLKSRVKKTKGRRQRAKSRSCLPTSGR